MGRLHPANELTIKGHGRTVYITGEKMLKAKITMERRGSPRISIKIPVKYRLERDEKVLKSIDDWRQAETNAYTLDVSLGGMQIAVDQSLKEGDVLQFDIPLLNKSKKVSVYANVIRTGRKSAGLQFLMMKDDEREALKAFFEFLQFNQTHPKTPAPKQRK
jgi:c-di-GMP-binding flagellar brake protein YcgR